MLPGEGLRRSWNAVTSWRSSARIPCKRANPPLTRTDATPPPLSLPPSSVPSQGAEPGSWSVFHSEGCEPETLTRLCANDCDGIRDMASLLTLPRHQLLLCFAFILLCVFFFNGLVGGPRLFEVHDSMTQTHTCFHFFQFHK